MPISVVEVLAFAAAKAAATLSPTSWSNTAWLTVGGTVAVALAGRGLARVVLFDFLLGGILLQHKQKIEIDEIAYGEFVITRGYSYHRLST